MKKKVLIVVSAIIFVICVIVIVMITWPDKKEVMAYEEKEDVIEPEVSEEVSDKDIVIEEIYYYTDDPEILPSVQESKVINGENYIYNGDMDVEIIERYEGIYLEMEEDLLYNLFPSETFVYESGVSGKTYELGLLSSEKLYETKVERGISESMYYKEELGVPDVDESIETVYHNGLRDGDEAALLEAVGVIKTNEYQKDVTINAVFECDDPANQEWVLGEDREPVLLEDNLHPVWAGYEDDILDILNLNKDVYTITGGDWDGDYYEEVNSDGVKVTKRNAIFYCKANVADYEVVYETKTEDLGYRWKEIYGLEGDVDPLDKEEFYYMKASVHYEKDSSDELSLYRENPDVKGVISIDDNVLNHPFVKTEKEDEYIRLGLNKEYNSYGVPFMDNQSDVDRVNSNSIIYGHNICKSNVDVFGELSLYTDESYRENHKHIEVDTDNGKSVFDVIACMVINIKDDDDVAYSDYNDLEDDDIRADFLSYINDRNLYDQEIEDVEGARYISLVTCYENYNDRLIVVGRCA